MPERIWNLIMPEVNTGCWLWIGALGNGYGTARWGNRSKRVHRIMYEGLVGAIPAGMDIDHVCRQRCCVNPSHLEPVTRQENLLRSPLTGARPQAQCGWGHEMTGDNVGMYPKGRVMNRHCKACDRRRSAARRAQQKAVA